MIRFIARRMFEAIPALFVVATVTFFLLRVMPGGPFDKEKATTPEIAAEMNAYYGLDKPLLDQYWRVMRNYLHGDLGLDYKYPNRTVSELIATSFPVSLSWAHQPCDCAGDRAHGRADCGNVAEYGAGLLGDVAGHGRDLPADICAGTDPGACVFDSLSMVQRVGLGLCAGPRAAVADAGFVLRGVYCAADAGHMLEGLNEEYIRTARGRARRGHALFFVTRCGRGSARWCRSSARLRRV